MYFVCFMVKKSVFSMEVLWADLTRKADNFESPAWHGDVLHERDQRVAEGKEYFID